MYKYCIVPNCTNTSIKTPEKLFLNVPKDPKLRKKWYSVVKKNYKTPPSAQATRHCCEDHFDLEEDMDNYMQFKLMGGKKRLKKDVLPHKFTWTEKPLKERTAVEKRRLREFYERVLSPEIHHEDLQAKPVEFITVVGDVIGDPIQVVEPEVVQVVPEESKKTFRSKSVQCFIKPKKAKVRSVHTNTDDGYYNVMEKKIQQQQRKIETLNKKVAQLELLYLERAFTPSDEGEGDFDGGSSDEYHPDKEIRTSTKLFKTRRELNALKQE